MLLEPPSDADLARTFQSVLDRILDGTLKSAPEGNGLDELTNAAINDLAKNLDSHRAVGIVNAWDEFTRQLNGTHARDAQKGMLKLLGP